MADPETYQELLAEIYGPRRSLIKAFHFFEGRANSKRLFDEADAPRTSKHHYLSTLQELQLIEKNGTEHGPGGETFVWRLTDRGQQVADDVVDDDTTTISDLEELEQRLTALERQADPDQQVQANSEAIEELRERIEDTHDRIEALHEAVTGETPNGTRPQ